DLLGEVWYLDNQVSLRYTVLARGISCALSQQDSDGSIPGETREFLGNLGTSLISTARTYDDNYTKLLKDLARTRRILEPGPLTILQGPRSDQVSVVDVKNPSPASITPDHVVWMLKDKDCRSVWANEKNFQNVFATPFKDIKGKRGDQVFTGASGKQILSND